MGIARRNDGRVHARVKIGETTYHLGSFETEAEARAVIEAEYARVHDGTSPLLKASTLVEPRVYAKRIGVPIGTLKRWIFEGMPCVKLNAHATRVDMQIADAWVAQHRADSVSFARESSVYFARRPSDSAIKIGWTSDVVRRVSELRKCLRQPVVLLAAIPGDKPVELALHGRFAEERIDPNDEWFRASDRLREFVASLGRSAA